ncbi:MAG: carboxymuconolactone decarboxylase family protein [Nitrospinota bacterium]
MAHGEFLRKVVRDKEKVLQIKEDWRRAGLPADEEAMLDFAEKLTLEPGKIERADVQRLRDAGYDDERILDIVLLTCYRNFINRLADGLGVEVDAGFRKDAEFAERLRP